MFRIVFVGFVLFLTVLSAVRSAGAAEYRIENDVQGVKSTVYLLPDRFYSMIGENGEIVEFDPQSKIFTLMEPAWRIQTYIDGKEIQKKVEQLRQEILFDPQADIDSFHYFMFKPVFRSEFDSDSGILALQSRWIDYEIKTIPFTEPSSGMYYDFCDWICYLNFRRNPRSSQMLVRMEVNRLLREGQRFAANVELGIIQSEKTGIVQSKIMGVSTVHYRSLVTSSHMMSQRLGTADHKRIEQAQEFKRTFPQVSFEEYQKRGLVASSDSQMPEQ